MTKIALLGAGSSVGRFILERTGDEVIGIYRSHRALSQLCDLNLGPRLKKASGVKELADALRGCSTAVNLVNDENPARAQASLTELFQACVDAGVSQLIHVSSATVYGCDAAKVTRLDEAPRGLTWSSYAIGKRWQEKVVKRAASLLPSVVVLRPGLIWGPGMAWLHKPASELARGEAWVVEGNARANLVHVSLLFDAIMYFAKEVPRGLHYCNVADRRPVTWRQYYQKIAVALGLPADTPIQTVPHRRGIWRKGIKSLRYMFPFGIGWSVLPAEPKTLVKSVLRPLFVSRAPIRPHWGPPGVAVDREAWELKAFDGVLPADSHLEKIHATRRNPDPGMDVLLKSSLANFPVWR